MATTDERPISEMRQEILEQVQDATALLGLVPRLIEENAALRAQAEAAAREVERVARETDRAHAEVEPLRNEMARYRAERDELTEVLGKVMTEVSALINELGPRFRMGKFSPFARDREAPAPVPTEPTLRPPMTPVLATR